MIMKTWIRLAALCCVLAVASGCATNNPRDPLEPYNRVMYTINDTVDRAVVKPTAEAYRAVTPSLVRKGIGNFFDNLSVPATVVNSLLQGKATDAVEGVFRFSFNTLFGFAGLLDIASEMGIARRYEDFGQTLGKWGVPAGPYLVLPVLGPSTVRDTGATLAYGQADELSPYEYIDNGHSETSIGLQIINGVNLRADLLDNERLLNDLALDRYTFIRDAYLQRRRNVVYDGDPPEEDTEKPPKYEDDPGPAKTPNPSSVPATPDTAPPAAPSKTSEPAKTSQMTGQPLKVAENYTALLTAEHDNRASIWLLPDATAVSKAANTVNGSTQAESEELKSMQIAPSLQR
jgi:phospholipid-binding lipoprotein MlaA